MTFEEKREKVMALRPIDDVFFEVLASQKAVCQEMLRTIMEDDKLIVEDVIPQSSERNIYGRSVRLDALCILGDGSRVNIEMQRSDNDDHLKRALFNASAITFRDSEAGIEFEDLPDLYIIYISEFDYLKEGKTTYHIDKVIRETGTVVDDGLQEIFVNTAVHDGTEITRLMSCFTKKQVKDDRFPILSEEMARLKETEGGLNSMCQVMQHYEDIARREGRAAGLVAGREEERIEILRNLLKNGMTSEAAMKLINIPQEKWPEYRQKISS